MPGCETCSYTFVLTPNPCFFKQNVSEFLEAVNYFLQFLTKKIHFDVHVPTFLKDNNFIDLHAFKKRYVSIQAC